MNEIKPSPEHRAALEARLLARYDQIHPQPEENPMKNFARRHGFDLLEFGSLKTEEGCHLNNLVFTYEIFWIGAKLFDYRFEFTATHCLRNVQAHSAIPGFRVMHAKFTNDHLAFRQSFRYTKRIKSCTAFSAKIAAYWCSPSKVTKSGLRDG